MQQIYQVAKPGFCFASKVRIFCEKMRNSEQIEQNFPQIIFTCLIIPEIAANHFREISPAKTR